MTRTICLTIAFASAALAVTGCGYTTDRPFRTDVQSVHVEMFQSREFRRGIEFRLTEAVRKQLEMTTEYKNATLKQADTVITGEVLEFRQAAFAGDFRTDLPREIGGVLICSFRWQDQRTGKVLQEVPRLVYQIERVPTVGETEFYGLDLAVDGMARKIVREMETSW